jgi:hypothetical protein
MEKKTIKENSIQNPLYRSGQRNTEAKIIKIPQNTLSIALISINASLLSEKNENKYVFGLKDIIIWFIDYKEGMKHSKLFLEHAVK